MSLLEDLFLEDEAGEAQELERVLEGGGDDYDERPISPNSDDSDQKDDEAEEDSRRVDPTKAKVKRVVKNPRVILNPARLMGPRGMQVIPDHFKDYKFKGKGHEKEDLDMVLKKLEHWAYRLYPKFAFHDCLKKIETLGKKRPVMVHLHKIRSGQLMSEESVVQRDSSDDEAPTPVEDEFDKLLQQQIDLARATPAPASAKKPAFSTPCVDRSHMMPKVTSSPSISDEQRERMLRNRQMAEERRLAKLRNESSNVESTNTLTQKSPEETNEHQVVKSNHVVSKTHNRSNIIDSSDEEDVTVVNESITIDADVHRKVQGSQNFVEIIDNKIMSNPKSPTDRQTSEVEITDEVIVTRHNGSNVIDSSDDEDAAVVNESIIVDADIHSKLESVNNDVEIVECLSSNDVIKSTAVDNVYEAKNDFDKLIAPSDDQVSNIHDKDDRVMLESPEESEVIVDNGENNGRNSSSVISDNVAEPVNKIKVVEMSESVGEEKNNKNNEKELDVCIVNDNAKGNDTEYTSNKENVDANIAEDIMEVDFNEDF